MALHSGWAIEGGIGSEIKLDATYISPQIDITSRLAYLCDEFSLQLVISDAVYNFLTAKVKSFLRKIDVIIMSEIKDPLGLCTFDMSEEIVEAQQEDHVIGQLILLEEFSSANIDAYKSKSPDYMFTTDADIAALHKGADEILSPYKEGLAGYISGDWESAGEWIEQVQGISPNDGPSRVLLQLMESYNFAAPEAWKGYRNIDESIPEQVFEEGGEEEKLEKPNEEEANSNTEQKKESNDAKGKHVDTKNQLVAIEEHEEEELLSSNAKKSGVNNA